MAKPKNQPPKKKTLPPSQTSTSSTDTTTTTTTTTLLRTRLSRATDLENKLTSTTQKKESSEETTSKLRFQLCEILSDILLSDPSFAMRKDVPGRLWRGCFYNRIGDLRGRLAREKGRLRRCSSEGEKREVQVKLVEDLERNLKVFLEEAIVLYDYLVDKYEGMLLPGASQSSQSQSHTQDSTPSQKGKRTKNRKNKSVAPTPTPPTPPTTTQIPNGTIQNLHRLLIHLGDLHRYASSFPQSETSYLRASTLAPGKGNPYNQLAVVAQLREGPLMAVALYWYGRSLCASGEVFGTSRANLVRLFGSNRDWLVEWDRKEKVEGGVVVVEGGKKDGKERVVKSVLGRKFLGRFVDLHWDFYRGVDLDSVEEVCLRMNSLLESFGTLLAGAAFGDALLCKLVAVNAFSVVTAGTNGGEKVDLTKEDEKVVRVVKTSRCLAVSFVLRFGAALAEQVVKTVSKLNQQKSGGNGAPTPSLRLLSPLILLCDFVSTLYDDDSSSSSSLGTPLPFDQEKGDWNEACITAEISFWEGVASLVNAIHSSPSFAPPDSKSKAVGGDNDIQINLKEYEALRGFAPFERFIGPVVAPLPFHSRESILGKEEANKEKSDDADDDNGVYVSPENAATVLGLVDAKPGKGLGNGGGSSSGAETRARIVRFLGFADLMTEPPTSGGSKHDCSVTYRLTKDSVTGMVSSLVTVVDCHMGVAADADDEPNVDVPSDDVDNEGTGDVANDDDGMDVDPAGEDDDVIVYKASQSGGAALLVPGALLLSEKKTVLDEEGADKNLVLKSEGEVQPRKVAEPMVGAVDLGDLLKPASLGGQAVSLFPPVSDGGDIIEGKGGQVGVPLPQSQPPKQAPLMVKPPPGFSGAPSIFESSSLPKQNLQETNVPSQGPPFYPSSFALGLGGMPPSESANSGALLNSGSVAVSQSGFGTIGAIPNNDLNDIPPPPPPGFQGPRNDVDNSNCVSLHTANPFATHGMASNGVNHPQQQQNHQQQLTDGPSRDAILPGLSTLFGAPSDGNLGPLLGFRNEQGGLATTENSLNWGSDPTAGKGFGNGSSNHGKDESRLSNYGIAMPSGNGLYADVDGHSMSHGGQMSSNGINPISLEGFGAHAADSSSTGPMVQGGVQQQHNHSSHFPSSQQYGDSTAHKPFATSNPFFT